jgi:hypothetical protein
MSSPRPWRRRGGGCTTVFAGLLASLPWLAAAFTATAAGGLADRLVRSGRTTRLVVRRGMHAVSTLGCAVAVLPLAAAPGGYLPPALATLCLVAAVGCYGFSFGGFHAYVQVRRSRAAAACMVVPVRHQTVFMTAIPYCGRLERRRGNAPVGMCVPSKGSLPACRIWLLPSPLWTDLASCKLFTAHARLRFCVALPSRSLDLQPPHAHSPPHPALLPAQDVAAADAGQLLGITNTASILGGIAGNLATGAVLQVGAIGRWRSAACGGLGA